MIEFDYSQFFAKIEERERRFANALNRHFAWREIEPSYMIVKGTYMDESFVLISDNGSVLRVYDDRDDDGSHMYTAICEKDTKGFFIDKDGHYTGRNSMYF